MPNNFGLSYLDALTKSLEIVKHDALIDEEELSAENQIKCLTNFYQSVDPDTSFNKCIAIEPNRTILKDETKFAMTAHFMHLQKLNMPRQNDIRFHHLMNKYQLGIENERKPPYNLSSLFILFPDLEYVVKLERPQLCRPLHKDLKIYKNFKKEYDLDGIMGLIPTGKKYGGFIKAYFHMQLLDNLKEYEVGAVSALFQHFLGKYRVIFNSSIYSEEERLELFNKLDIKEENCFLWSKIFDKQFPKYKDLHKFFGQIE